MKKLNFDRKIILNAGKIAIGCVISMLICIFLNLKYSTASGLITVLSIQNTKRETLNTALKRLYAFFCAIFISLICFKLLGYNAISFGIYLFIFVIICILCNWQSATVPVSVLVTHLLSEKSIEPSLILNEFMIFVIGAGTGILINTSLKKDKEKMRRRRESLDNEIRAVLERMSKRILIDDKSDYNSECFKRIDMLMFEARQSALENRDNDLRHIETYDVEYLEMRKNQCSVLYEMYKSIIHMNTTPEQALIISDFIKKSSVEYHEKNDVRSLIGELERIFEEMRFQPMPESRIEFENRAILYTFMLQMREFLTLKYEFIARKSEKL